MECFCDHLAHSLRSSLSPIPKIRWRKVDGILPPKVGASAEGPILIIPELNFDDEGMYECEVYNLEGRETHQGRISVQGRHDVRTRFSKRFSSHYLY